MSSFNSITMTRSMAVSKDRVWSFMTDTSQAMVYFPFIKSSFSEQVQLNTVRVSVAHWDDFYGTFRERCIGWEPKQNVKWRVEEDAMRIFPSDFVWNFQIEETAPDHTVLHFTVEYRSRNRLMKVIDKYRIKNRLKNAMDNIQTKLR